MKTHIFSGDSFGDISADLSKAVFDSDCLNKGRQALLYESAIDKIKKSAG